MAENVANASYHRQKNVVKASYHRQKMVLKQNAKGSNIADATRQRLKMLLMHHLKDRKCW